MNLVERLAAKLDIAVEEAAQLLEQFLQDAQQKLQRGQEVDLPGVGTFQQTGSGTVDFIPDPPLEAVVNYRFTGLSTVEVSSSPKPPDITAPEESEAYPDEHVDDRGTSTPNGTEEAPAAPTAAGESASELLDEEVDQFWDEKRTNSPLGPRPHTAEETSYSVVESEERDENEDPPISETSAAGETEETENDESPKELTGQATFPRNPRSSDTNSRRKLSILAGFLITSGVILLMYFAWFRGPTSSSPSETTRQPTTAPTTSAEDNRDDNNTEAAPPPSSEMSTEESSSSSGTSENSPFESPLRGDESITPEHGGYSWVVASLSDRGAAEDLRNTYAQNGFRTAIFTGGRGYRVAVGQFETVEDVVATRDELPEDVSSTAWVLKIESNMSPLVSS